MLTPKQMNFIDQLKQKGTVGWVASSWDCLHPGHVLLVKDCYDHCDFVIAGLQTDPTLDRVEKNKPIMTLQERKLMLESIKYISCIVEYDTEENHRKILDLIQPTMMFKGSDWKEKDIPEWNGEMAIIWHERDHDWSSTNFRKKIYEAERKKRED